ncbi:imidazole glycerol phosphate synthase subunit HisH [Woeseia oceani]|uniref:Imidazole glycerol phosphate synthase subunit HisH n=1 Tax=Woeseia oceani TaxID=1548547 RepID=A0A193LG55_9GAMM|nr:imidazole glycerol phosphate synthase subunit HisH [Woeseia oceani]ANO51441.1 imidazole glycerol phosphate synthase, glutamine amidotransferase subunit [Woeseia oceani]
MKNDVVIIDSGGANIASLMFALERLGAAATLTTDKEIIGNAPRVILPGVGAAADAMLRLEQHDLLELIPNLTQPVLGVCLGMQLLAQHSAEGDTRCLGIIPATAAKLPDDQGIPVPNMGWCRIENKRDHPLLHGIENGSWFYFVHSYALPPGDYSCANARHVDDFCAIASQANFFAAQCHPERSAKAGARLLKNFLQIS